jgi:hypothetical protein
MGVIQLIGVWGYWLCVGICRLWVWAIGVHYRQRGIPDTAGYGCAAFYPTQRACLIALDVGLRGFFGRACLYRAGYGGAAWHTALRAGLIRAPSVTALLITNKSQPT